MTNTDFSLPSDLSGLEESPAQYVARNRVAAQQAANQGLDGNGDEAVRAGQLAQSSGDNPSLIYGDLENYERQRKAFLTSKLLENNSTLRDYALAHPLNATLSQNDWGQLDAASEATRALSTLPFVPFAVKQFKAQWDDFKKDFGEEPIGSWIGDAYEKMGHTDFMRTYPNLYNLIKWPFLTSPVGAVVTAAEAAVKVPSGIFDVGLKSLNRGLVSFYQTLGMDQNHAESLARENVAVVEAESMGLTGRHPLPEAEAPRGLHPEAFKTVMEEAQKVGREDRMR